MRKIPVLLLSLAFYLTTPGQSFQSIEIKSNGSFGEKKLKNAEKKIYIDQFRVIYQLMYIDEEKKEGGRTLGGGYKVDDKFMRKVQAIPADGEKYRTGVKMVAQKFLQSAMEEFTSNLR